MSKLLSAVRRVLSTASSAKASFPEAFSMVSHGNEAKNPVHAIVNSAAAGSLVQFKGSDKWMTLAIGGVVKMSVEEPMDFIYKDDKGLEHKVPLTKGLYDFQLPPEHAFKFSGKGCFAAASTDPEPYLSPSARKSQYFLKAIDRENPMGEHKKEGVLDYDSRKSWETISIVTGQEKAAVNLDYCGFGKKPAQSSEGLVNHNLPQNSIVTLAVPLFTQVQIYGDCSYKNIGKAAVDEVALSSSEKKLPEGYKKAAALESKAEWEMACGKIVAMPLQQQASKERTQ